MKIDALANELAERWAPLMRPMDWRQRLRVLGEIHEKLLEDLGNFDVYAELSPRFIARLIEQMSNGAVISLEQAHIYANSGDPRHRAASGDWFRRSRSGENAVISPVPDRRVASRHPVNRPASFRGNAGGSLDCWLVNLSRSGALITAPDIPDMGSEIVLDIPEVGAATGDVVRVAPPTFALHFHTPLADHPLH